MNSQICSRQYQLSIQTQQLYDVTVRDRAKNRCPATIEAVICIRIKYGGNGHIRMHPKFTNGYVTLYGNNALCMD